MIKRTMLKNAKGLLAQRKATSSSTSAKAQTLGKQIEKRVRFAESPQRTTTTIVDRQGYQGAGSLVLHPRTHVNDGNELYKVTVISNSGRAVTGSSPVRKRANGRRQIVKNRHELVVALKKMMKKGDSSVEEATEMLANLGLGSKLDTQLEQLLRKFQSVDLNKDSQPGPPSPPKVEEYMMEYTQPRELFAESPYEPLETCPSSLLGLDGPKEPSWLEQEDEIERQMNICVEPYGCRVAVTQSSSNNAEMEDCRASMAIISLYERLIRLWDKFGMAPKVTFETVWLRADLQGETTVFEESWRYACMQTQEYMEPQVSVEPSPSPPPQGRRRRAYYTVNPRARGYNQRGHRARGNMSTRGAECY